MTDASSPVRPALRTSLICAGLFAGTVLLYVRALGYGFSIYDDPIYVTNNPHVQAGFTWSGLVWAFAGRADYWHPLTWLSHMADWRLYGENAAGHHLTSVLWHALNAVLAFAVLRRLTGAYWTAAVGAALFAWHPLRVESVVWITERKDVMSGTFLLLTISAYATYAQRRAHSRRAAPWYLGTLALFVGGLMCKPMLVTVPVVLLLMDFWPLQRAALEGGAWRAWLPLLREKIPFFVGSLAASVATVLMQQDKGAFVLDLPIDARVGNALVSILRYVAKTLWPFDLTICYPHPGRWPLLVVAGAALTVAAITLVGFRLRRSRPWILAGWAWYCVMLLPALGLLQVGFQAMADRYSYLPILGLQLAVLWTLRDLCQSRAARWLGGAAAALVLVGLGARTWDQEATWQDSATLFRHAVASTQRNEFAHAFLGYTYISLDRTDDALEQSRAALALNPRNPMALFTVAEAQAKRGQLDEAIRSYRAYLDVKPGDASAQFSLGRLLLQRGQLDEGVQVLTMAAKRSPDVRGTNLEFATRAAFRGDARAAALHFGAAVAADAQDATAQFGLGYALSQLGRLDEARPALEAALRLRPDYADAHTQLGLLLLARGEGAAALAHFQAALASEPKHGLAYLGLGRVLEQQGDSAGAASAFERAVDFAPANVLTRRAWARTLARRGQFVESVVHYERALRLDPRDANTCAELGYVLWLAGRRGDAAAVWQRALQLDPNLPGLRERMTSLGIP